MDRDQSEEETDPLDALDVDSKDEQLFPEFFEAHNTRFACEFLILIITDKGKRKRKTEPKDN